MSKGKCSVASDPKNFVDRKDRITYSSGGTLFLFNCSLDAV